MKILLTTHQFFPQFSAGTEVLTLTVARELIARGHEVRVLTGYPGSATLSDKDRFDEYDFEGIRVHRFHHAYVPMGGQTSMIEIGYNNRLCADFFGFILKSLKPDVVHCFHLNRLGTGLIERAVHADIPCFMTPTDFWTICATGQLLLPDGRLCVGPNAHAGNCLKHFAQSTQKSAVGRIAKWLPTAGANLLVHLTKVGALPKYPKQPEVLAIGNRLSSNVSRLNQLNGLIVPNQFMKEFLVRHGVFSNLITVAAFGISATSPAPNTRQANHNAPLRVGFIGTLAPHKGCHILIEAFSTLPATCATLKIYGRLDEFPDYVAELQSRVQNHRSIEFCGTFPNSEIRRVFTDIDVLVVPSMWYENTPLVLYSAQAARCPVVASNLPGLSEVIEHDKNGLLFAAGSSVDLAQQLFRLLNEGRLLQKLSANARATKSTGTYVDELMAVWEQGN